MDSPSDLFGRQSSLISPFVLYPDPSTALDLPRHLTPSGGGHGAPYPGANPSYPLIHHLLQPGGAPMRSGGELHLDRYNMEEEGMEEEEEEEEGMGGRLVGVGGKRLSGDALEADWSYDMMRVKRLRLESLDKGDGEIGLEEEEEEEEKRRRSAERGNREKGREGRRREREELKEQLEEARGRLKALQEKVWKAFGERPAQEEEKRWTGGEQEEDEEVGEIDDLSLPFIPSSPHFQGIARRDRKARDHEKRSEEQRNANGGGEVLLEGVLERAAVWMGCGVVRGEWERFGGEQKFAQALKQELGSAVARVIDRVLRLYTQNEPLPPSIHPFTLAPSPYQEQSEALPLITRRPDNRRNHLLPLNNHPNIRTKNPLLPPHPFPPLCQPHHHTHPALLPPSSCHKDSSPFLPPSSCPLPLPLLHYTMQQLFTRSLSHLHPLHKGNPFLPHLTPSSSSSHPSFPPLAVMEGLDRLDGGLQHHHERDGGMRGGGRDGGMDSGMYLGPGSISFFFGGGEGLSPCHLKKAKLMFFYARYPSSNTLKTYFPDVKFNRCVTSQLIKWFSNFREFFYIQMERFARQAARDGAPCLGREGREPPLRLGRDTELYRILNMHYNKSNDYQVPDRFVEIAELALREFYTAIQTGRDSDPCWKKSIYKIVCKLDSPVPDSFRLPGCPMG
uniref:Prospero domain-containing protein n=1 Tax=Oncorhynchus kisutch TaxID=8019 RepID=A0A8C7IUF1_ONCKI